MFQSDMSGNTKRVIETNQKSAQQRNIYMLDDDNITAKTVNSFKSKLKRKRAKKMGFYGLKSA